MHRAVREEEELIKSSRLGMGEQIPWLRHMGFQDHLQGLSRKDITMSYAKPISSKPGFKVMNKLGERADEALTESLSLCQNGKNCKMTRPMAVILTKFEQMNKEVNGKFKGFNINIQLATARRYFDLWKGLLYYFYRVTQGHILLNKESQVLCAVMERQ